MRSRTRAHRRALRRRLPDGLLVLTAAPEVIRNGDVHHPYRQDSDFLWLTGVEAPGYALVLDARRGAETLFIPACLLPAAALHGGTFAPWMAAPMGACFLLIIPLPCYWEAVDRIRWLHAARNALFVLLAVACFAVALGWLPLGAIGL